MNKKSIFSYCQHFYVPVLAAFLFCSYMANAKNTVAQPFSLQIDFSKNVATNQDGYQPYLAEHEDNNSFVPQTYTIGDITVSIDAEWPPETNNTAKQMIDRGAIDGNEYSNLLRDWIGTDGRSSKVPMTLTISGLPAGLYEWKSYHHDQMDQTGLFSTTIFDAAGSAVHSGIDISNGSLPIDYVTVFETLLKSDGSEIVLSFKNDTYPDNSTSFFLMNGFVLNEIDTTILPEKVELISPLNG